MATDQKCIWTCFHISYQTGSWQKSFIYYNQMIHWVVNLDCDKTRPGRDPKILGTNTHWPVATALWLPNPNIELENSWLLKTVSWFSKYVLCAFKLASRYQEGTFLFLEASFIFLFPDIEIDWCSAVPAWILRKVYCMLSEKLTVKLTSQSLWYLLRVKWVRKMTG